jgi:hypothetical protein
VRLHYRADPAMSTWAFRLIVNTKSAHKAEVSTVTITILDIVMQYVREAFFTLTVKKRFYKREKRRAFVAFVRPPPPLFERGSLP